MGVACASLDADSNWRRAVYHLPHRLRIHHYMPRHHYPFDNSIGFMLGRTLRTLRPLMEQRVKSAGISDGMWFFLRVLWNKDGVSQREIADAVGLTQPTAWAALKKLEAQRLVALERDLDDRRRTIVHLTKKGRDLEAVLLPRVEEINVIALKGISEKDTQTFLRVLGQIHDNVRASGSYEEGE